jgi:hypothetical protein
MLKKIGIPLLTLAAMLVLVPAPQAKAGVRFGVYVGAPAYVAPAPVFPYAYPAPGYYTAYPAYPYPAPAYVSPYAAWRGHEYWERRNHEGREHDRREDRDRWRR